MAMIDDVIREKRGVGEVIEKSTPQTVRQARIAEESKLVPEGVVAVGVRAEKTQQAIEKERALKTQKILESIQAENDFKGINTGEPLISAAIQTAIRIPENFEEAKGDYKVTKAGKDFIREAFLDVYLDRATKMSGEIETTLDNPNLKENVKQKLEALLI